MNSTSNLFLTNTNYFQWKSYMEGLLRSKGLYQITLRKEKEPTNADNKFKCVNSSDEACGLIEIFISPDLRFHLQEIDDLDDAW